MKKFISFFSIILICVYLTSCGDVLDGIKKNLSEDEVAEGLKTALRVGADTSVTKLNRMDGYFRDQAVKIFLPQEAQVIVQYVSYLPGGQAMIDNTILSMNRAAEDAAVQAKPILVDAITGITIQDAFSILRGSDTAATHYLRNSTFSPLIGVFRPHIDASLKKPLVLGVSTYSLYQDMVNSYNTVANNSFGLIPGVSNADLTSHVTNRALQGLFLKVANEETLIRTNVNHRVNDILQKVFSEENR